MYCLPSCDLQSRVIQTGCYSSEDGKSENGFRGLSLMWPALLLTVWNTPPLPV